MQVGGDVVTPLPSTHFGFVNKKHQRTGPFLQRQVSMDLSGLGQHRMSSILLIPSTFSSPYAKYVFYVVKFHFKL